MSSKSSEEPEDGIREERVKRRRLGGQSPQEDTRTQEPIVVEEPQTSQSDHPPQTEQPNVPRTHPSKFQEPDDSEVTIVLQKRKETQPVMSPLNTIPLFGPVTYVDLEDDDFIQSGGACYQVFKTKAKHFSSVITQELDPEEIIIGKILGPSAWVDEKFCDLDRKKIDAENHYQMERKCITELMNDNEFNNCFIKYKEFRATIVIPEWAYDWDDMPVDIYISGRCILSKYIDSDPYNEETYEKA